MVDKQKNNPKNETSPLFKGLTKLFSGPVSRFRSRSPAQQKKYQLDKYSFKSMHGQSFKKSEYDPFKSLYLSKIGSIDRFTRYLDFEQMEFVPILNSALDIYADEMTTHSPLSPILKVSSTNQEIKDILHELFYEILNVELNLNSWCRSFCKYGDFFLYIDIDDKMGIKNVIGLPVKEVERLEGEDLTNPNLVRFQWKQSNATFENWQVAHFRNLGNEKYVPLGTSVLEPARRVFRQLTLMEDAMMAYRVIRAPERNAFYLDVKGIKQEDVPAYVLEIQKQMKQNQIVDSATGQIDLRYASLGLSEDYFLPVRGQDSGTRIEKFTGGQLTDAIEDIKYLRESLFAAIKIPQSYLIMAEGASEDQSSLAQKDIRFARTIQKLQKSVISELIKIAQVHLFTLGFRGDDLLCFKLELNNPSKIAELQELEHYRAKFEVASAASEGFYSRRWVSKNILGLSDEEIIQLERERFHDKNVDALLEAEGESLANSEVDSLAALTGDDSSGDTKDGEDPVLLATPDEAGKKNEATTTAASKGKIYHPVKDDKRDMGARHRSFVSKGGDSAAENSKRNVFKGLAKLKTLQSGIAEEQDKKASTSYEEKAIFEKRSSLETLIRSLEKGKSDRMILEQKINKEEGE